MNGFDILFLIVLALGAWKGWSNGLLKEVLGLIGVFVGLYLAYLLYEQVGYELAPHIGTSPSIASIIAFALIWIGVPIVLGVLGSLLTKVLEWAGLDGVNNLGGALLSVVKYAILLGAVCNVLSRISSPPSIFRASQPLSFMMRMALATPSAAFT